MSELLAMVAQAPIPAPSSAAVHPHAGKRVPLPNAGVVPPLPSSGRVATPRPTRAVPPRSRHAVPAPRSPRSAFAVVAASAVGAGTAAASMSGAFSAVPDTPAREVGDTQSFAAVQPVDLVGPSGFTAAPATFSSPIAPAAQAAAPATATVMAADLHQTDAQQIASLSRAVDLDRAQTVALAAQAAAQVVQNALVNKVTSLTGVTPLFDGSSQVATKALTTAITKMGVPYVWGATGPNAFDCSGLVQWSYRQMGVNLPRTAAQQSQVGTPVSRGQLRAGDLVFFYSPVSHVGIYLGNNKILNASESGQPVKVSSMANTPFHNARRIT